MLAVAPAGVERFLRVLSGHDVMVVGTLSEALRNLEEEKFGMVIIGVHFDESQMFELLHHVRLNRHEPAVPTVCVHGESGTLSNLVLQGLDHAVKAMMGNAFLDLRKMPDDKNGNARLRRIIDYLILIDGDLHQGLEQGASSGAKDGEEERRAEGPLREERRAKVEAVPGERRRTY